MGRHIGGYGGFRYIGGDGSSAERVYLYVYILIYGYVCVDLCALIYVYFLCVCVRARTRVLHIRLHTRQQPCHTLKSGHYVS